MRRIKGVVLQNHRRPWLARIVGSSSKGPDFAAPHASSGQTETESIKAWSSLSRGLLAMASESRWACRLNAFDRTSGTHMNQAHAPLAHARAVGTHLVAGLGAGGCAHVRRLVVTCNLARLCEVFKFAGQSRRRVDAPPRFAQEPVFAVPASNAGPDPASRPAGPRSMLPRSRDQAGSSPKRALLIRQGSASARLLRCPDKDLLKIRHGEGVRPPSAGS